MSFTESNITLAFPDSNHFRLQDTSVYQQLSAYYFKEMDACWFDTETSCYWLIELKDFTVTNLDEPQSMEKRAWDIVKKSIDTLCMFLSARHQYTQGNQLYNHMTTLPDKNINLRFVTIIHCTENQEVYIQQIHNFFRNRFKAYTDLFDIKWYAVMSHKQAKKKLPAFVA